MKILSCGLGLVLCLGLTACNTISGAGKDIQATGKAISNTADKVKKEL